jgi:hypothetical protein
MPTLQRVASALLSIAVIAIAASAAGQSSPPSGRHGDGHAENHDWYKDLRQPDTRSRCCNGTVDGKQGDCRPTQSFIGEDGLYRAWDGREWLVVPKSKMIFMTTPDGSTHLCETYGRVFCFILGDPQS